MIEIYLLEHLAALHRLGTLSAASEELHITQPTLSRSMQKLEQLLGVRLFDRQKNRIQLNATGILAAEHAEHILNEVNRMELQVRAFDRSLRTLSIGSCAPGPLFRLLPQAASFLSGITVSSAIKKEEELILGLRSSEFDMIVLTHPLESDELINKEYMSEHLYVTVPPFHPAAVMPSVSFSDMNGQNFIMHTHVGFWDGVVRTMMPDSRFILQDDVDAVGELADHSDLPAFSTDISREALPSRRNSRIHVPFSDPEAQATYYLICRKGDYRRWKKLFFASSTPGYLCKK